jgi:hypothetical protein
MAVIQGQRQQVNSGVKTPNVMASILLRDSDLSAAMFLAYISRLPKMATPDAVIKWETDTYLPTSDTTAASVTAASNSITVSNVNYFIPNTTWYNKRTGENFKVASVDSANSQISVIRGLGAKNNGSGTAATAMNSGDTLNKLGTSVNPEKSTSQVTHTTTLTEVENYCQAVRYELEMGRETMKSSYLTGKDWPYQFDKTYKEAQKGLSTTFLFSEKSSYTDENNVPHRTTQGMFNVPTTNSFSVGGTLYETALDSWLVDEAFRYGSQRKTLLCSTDVIKGIVEMGKSRLQYSDVYLDKKKQLGFQVLQYMSPTGGILDIVEDRNISEQRNGDGVVVDFSDLKYRHFSANGIMDDLHWENLDAQDNDATNKQAYIYGQIGLQWGDEANHGIITGVTGGSQGRSVS